MIERIFISPEKRLMQGVIDCLCSDHFLRRSPMGVPTLAHCMLILPTAESNRQLRLALAKHFGTQGLLSPQVKQPAHILYPASESYPEATMTELYAAMLTFLESSTNAPWHKLFTSTQRDDDEWLGFSQMCVELWRTLATKGYTFKDVATLHEARALFANECEEEQERWDAFAAFEADFLNTLHNKKRSSPFERFSGARKALKPLDRSIDTLILPALVDAMPLFYDALEQYHNQHPELRIVLLLHATPEEANDFDAWGRPLPDRWTLERVKLDHWLPNDAIQSYVQNNELAEATAKTFPLKGAGLSVLDKELFTPLELAFQCEGIELHNPGLHALSQSSLGRLTINFLTLLTQPAWPWTTFSAILQENDVLSAIESREKENFNRTRCLKELNDYQNNYFPRTFNPTFHNAQHYPMLACAAKILHELLTLHASTLSEHLRKLFIALYEGRTTEHMSQQSKDEFRGAITALTQLINEFEADLPRQLSLEQCVALFRMMLSRSTYSLEEASPDALQTLGWLELAWSHYDHLVIVGMSEKILPEAVVGHAFLPDKLCNVLQLNTNAKRFARDAFVLQEILRSRNPGNVQIAISLASNTGETQKPSRLLYLCSNEVLVQRVKNFFGEISSIRSMAERTISPEWCFNIPPVPKTVNLPHISPSSIDRYLACPFTYYLSDILKLKPIQTKQEPEAQDFGLIFHAVLDAYATSLETRDLVEEEDIHNAVLNFFNIYTLPLRSEHTKNITLSLNSIEMRLKNFAKIQSQLREEGWEIIESEYAVGKTTKKCQLFYDLPFTIKGTIDRIDYHEKHGYRIIDYKTWDDIKDAQKKIFATERKCSDDFECRGLPLMLYNDISRNKTITHCHPPKSIQLYLYRYALEKLEPKRFHNKIVDLAYLILGRTSAQSGLFNSLGQTKLNSLYAQAIEVIHTTAHALHQGIFWPPSQTDLWQRDYRQCFLTAPQEELPDAWVADQNERLRKWKASREDVK